MPNKQNISAVAELETKLSSAQAVYLADYAGLTVKEQVKLRQAVQAAGGYLTVAKNSLLKIAMTNQGLDTTKLESDLTGPNITLFALTEAVAPLKAMVEFAGSNEKELPKLKSGILGKEILSFTQVIQLSKLPSKLELIAKLLGTLSNPARNLVSVLSAPMRNFVYALSAINHKKETYV
ncbi:MAG: 50S ribosomal protein L10, partial [uncultured bacterium]